jgi:hypothetical protein
MLLYVGGASETAKSFRYEVPKRHCEMMMSMLGGEEEDNGPRIESM